MGRSKLLNALVSCHGFRSGSGYIMMKTTAYKVFCHHCITALTRNKVKWNKGESTFVNRGYSNWKDAIMAFKSTKDQIVIGVP